MTLTHIAARAALRLFTVGVLVFGLTDVRAAPWAEVGDAQLRSDIETLATAGVIENLTTEWPVPWSRVLDRLSDSSALTGQPTWVVDAAERIRTQAASQMAPDTTSFSAYFDGTNAPEVVRAFDALGRENVQTQGILSWNGESTFIQLSAGLQSHDKFDSQTMLLDGTYIAKQFGNTAVYAGYMTHWWGPGWISALSLSNNAHPIPQIGFSRIGTKPSDSKWISWLGPWQAEFFLGELRGDNIPAHTLLDGLRLSIKPAPGLEIGLERLDEWCGQHHPCSPAEYFNPSNSVAHPSKSNDQADIDVKYSRELGALDLSLYLQVMNEDSNPIWHSASSHLFGLTGWVPAGSTRVRITVEYANSIGTQQIFSFGDYFYGTAYNDYKYLGGMRNFDRTVGFSLDSDAKLATLQASWLGAHNITWTLTYHHADLNVTPPPTATVQSLVNYVSSGFVPIDIGQVRASFPLLDHFTVDVEARYSSDQPRPAHGSEGAGEVRLRYSL